MNQYIRDFHVKTIETYSFQNYEEPKNVIQVNKNVENFKILHNNIRSINKNLDELKILLNNMEVDIDCIVLTETWKLEYPDLFNIEGYNMLYNCGEINQNDGVVAYIKSSLKFKYEVNKIGKIKVLNITINFNKNHIIHIIAVYRSPATDPYEFNTNLQNYLQTISKTSDHYIFIGDINLDLEDPKTDYIMEYTNILNEFGFISTINAPTREKACLDHIFYKPKNSYYLDLLLPIVIHSNITDHSTTILQIVLSKQKSIINDQYYIKSIDNDKLNVKLSNTSWNSVYTAADVESATKKFVEIITQIVEECTITKKIKRKNNKKTKWITNGILKSVNRKNEMFKLLKRTPNNLELKQQYTEYKNKLTNVIKKTKQNYYQNLINEKRSNTKELWKVVQEITKSNLKTNDITSLKNERGEIITDLKEITNEFNETFTNMGKNLAKKIKTNKKSKFNKQLSINSLALLPTDSEEIKTIINQLKNNKSPGIDNLKAETLKPIALHLIEPLVYIINECMRVGFWPSIFKDTLIIPIFKRGENTEASNYRPISLITNFTKIFEKVLKSRLVSFLNKNKLLSQKQYGFKENISTQDAIIDLINNVSSAMDKGTPCLCIFIDLSKAFDTVSHPLLLQSLENIGVRGICLQLLKSYISNRQQCVRIGDVCSESRTIEYGVPQGTVLGPVLFSIYINDLFYLPNQGDIIGFADDTAIFYKAETWEDLQHMVQNNLGYIKEWFDHKLLTVNLEKTNYIPFTCNKSTRPSFNAIGIEIQGKTHNILPKTEVKYLGVFIDCHLRWNVHINYVIRKLQSILHKFKYLCNILDQNHLRTIYYALVESHINYGILSWGAAVKHHLQPLEVLQKRFLKLMLHKKNTYPSDEIYLEANLLDVRQLFYYNSIIKYHFTNKEQNEMSHEYNTRKQNRYLPPFMTKSIGQRSQAFLAPKLYNTLPQYIKSCNFSIFSLKREIKNYIFTLPRQNIHQFIEMRN